MKLGKKGQNLNTLASFGMAVVFVGVALGLGIYINREFRNTSFSGNTVTNESVTFANDSWALLGYAAVSISEVDNFTADMILATDADTTGTAYYDVQLNYDGVTAVKIITNATLTAGTWNVTYLAYNEPGSMVIANATESMEVFASWLPTISVIMAAAVVVGILALYLKRGL